MRIGFRGMFLAVVLFGLGVGAAFAAGQASIRLATPAAAAGTPAVATGQGQGRATQGGAAQGTTGDQSQAAGQGFRGAGTIGTIAEVGEGVILLRTAQGETKVQVTEATSVRRMAEAALDDLKPGDRVTVVGDPQEGGAIAARTIQVMGAEESADAAPAGGQRRTNRP